MKTIDKISKKTAYSIIDHFREYADFLDKYYSSIPDIRLYSYLLKHLCNDCVTMYNWSLDSAFPSVELHRLYEFSALIWLNTNKLCRPDPNLRRKFKRSLFNLEHIVNHLPTGFIHTVDELPLDELPF